MEDLNLGSLAPESATLYCLLPKLIKAEWVSVSQMTFNLPRRDGMKEVKVGAEKKEG